MNFTKYINFPVFITSFFVGLLVVYLYTDRNKKIYVYPTPETVDILQYRDQTGHCFSFQQKEVSCPKDKKKISHVPMQ
jgi:hypothetical protein